VLFLIVTAHLQLLNLVFSLVHVISAVIVLLITLPLSLLLLVWGVGLYMYSSKARVRLEGLQHQRIYSGEVFYIVNIVKHFAWQFSE